MMGVEWDVRVLKVGSVLHSGVSSVVFFAPVSLCDCIVALRGKAFFLQQRLAFAEDLVADDLLPAIG